MGENETKSGLITKLKFSRTGESGKDNEFVVMLNPDTINRSLRMGKSENKSSKSKSKGNIIDCLPETITFSFYLDGTNVVNDAGNNDSVSNQIKHFLSVVYEKDNKPVQSVTIEYLSETNFIVATNSIDINYTLFDRNGNPLRAKISCTFSTIIPDKPNTEKKKQRKTSKPNTKKETRNETPSCVCVCTCPEDARKNNYDSLYTSMNANYSTSDGRAIKV